MELRQDVLETRPRPDQHLAAVFDRLCGRLVQQEGPEGKEKLKLLVNEYDQVLVHLTHLVVHCRLIHPMQL